MREEANIQISADPYERIVNGKAHRNRIWTLKTVDKALELNRPQLM